MADAGQGLLEDRVGIALLQEPYAVHTRVCGLPSAMRIFAYTGEGVAKAAVVVVDDTLDAMVIPELVTTTGVCVAIVGPFGRIVVCSLYCQHGGEIEHDLHYLRRVIVCAGGTPLLVGMDANAVSPIWFAKGDNR